MVNWSSDGEDEMQRSLVNCVLSGQLTLCLLLLPGALAHESFAQLEVLGGDKLVAGDCAANALFGTCVAISGNTLIVGASADDVPPSDAGSAYVYTRSGAHWVFQAKLTATTPSSSKYFGTVVAIDGDRAVVGAPGGVPSAFVFERSGSTWTQQQELGGPGGGDFATAVDIDGDTIVVGSWQSTASGSPLGAAYVYVLNGATWTLEDTLVPSDTRGSQPYFGLGVAISGNTIIAGAPQSDIGTEVHAGAAYVFTRAGSTWTEQQMLTAGDPGLEDGFGFSVDVSGSTAIVSAQYDDNDGGSNAGAAYVFQRSGTTWTQQEKLLPSDPEADAEFGCHVAVSADLAIVGALWSDGAGTQDSGSAYAFLRLGSDWQEQSVLTAADADEADHLGSAVGLSDGTFVIGAVACDIGEALNAGAAYTFFIPGKFTDLGGGLTGASGIPQLSGTGLLVSGTSGTLSLTGAPMFSATMLFVSLATTPVPFKGGVLSTYPFALQFMVPTFFASGWTLPWSTWPSGLPAGANVFFQVAVADPAAVQGVSISNLLRATTP